MPCCRLLLVLVARCGRLLGVPGPLGRRFLISLLSTLSSLIWGTPQSHPFLPRVGVVVPSPFRHLGVLLRVLEGRCIPSLLSPLADLVVF